MFTFGPSDASIHRSYTQLPTQYLSLQAVCGALGSCTSVSQQLSVAYGLASRSSSWCTSDISAGQAKRKGNIIQGHFHRITAQRYCRRVTWTARATRRRCWDEEQWRYAWADARTCGKSPNNPRGKGCKRSEGYGGCTRGGNAHEVFLALPTSLFSRFYSLRQC